MSIQAILDDKFGRDVANVIIQYRLPPERWARNANDELIETLLELANKARSFHSIIDKSFVKIFLDCTSGKWRHEDDMILIEPGLVAWYRVVLRHFDPTTYYVVLPKKYVWARKKYMIFGHY